MSRARLLCHVHLHCRMCLQPAVLFRSHLSVSTKLRSRICILSCRTSGSLKLLQQMSSHGSEKRRAPEDSGRSDAWETWRQDEYHTRQRREASASTQRSDDWQWVRQQATQWTASGDMTDRSDSSKPWTLWEKVQERKRRPDEDAMSVQSDAAYDYPVPLQLTDAWPKYKKGSTALRVDLPLAVRGSRRRRAYRERRYRGERGGHGRGGP